MSATKDLFEQIQEQNFYNLGVKELQQLAEQQAKEVAEQEQEDVWLHKTTKAKKYIEAFEKEVKGHLIDRYSPDYYSQLIEVKEMSRLTLDYEQDAIYKELNDRLKERKKLLDVRHKLNKEIVDNETGEVVPLIPVKSNTSFLTIKLK